MPFDSFESLRRNRAQQLTRLAEHIHQSPDETSRDHPSPDHSLFSEPEGWLMPFGKYKGLPVESLPTDYLGWLLDKFDEGEFTFLNGDERTEIVAQVVDAFLERDVCKGTRLQDIPTGYLEFILEHMELKTWLRDAISGVVEAR